VWLLKVSVWPAGIVGPVAFEKFATAPTIHDVLAAANSVADGVLDVDVATFVCPLCVVAAPVKTMTPTAELLPVEPGTLAEVLTVTVMLPGAVAQLATHMSTSQLLALSAASLV
jgi:hypothetical protein